MQRIVERSISTTFITIIRVRLLMCHWNLKEFSFFISSLDEKIIIKCTVDTTTQ